MGPDGRMRAGAAMDVISSTYHATTTTHMDSLCHYIFEGKTMLIDVCRVMNIDKASFDRPDGEADSLAGLVLELYGKMPVVGQQIDMPPFSFTILSVSARRIERIKVQFNP